MSGLTKRSLTQNSSLLPAAALAVTAPAPTLPAPGWPGLAPRVVLLAAIFVAEVLAASVWLDTATLGSISGLTGLVGDLGPSILRSLVAAAAIFATLGYLKRGSAFHQISALLVQTPIRWTLLGGHFGLMAAFAGLSFPLFGGKVSGASADIIMGTWLLAGFAAIPLAAFAFLPPGICLKLARSTGGLWAYASAAGALAWLAGSLNRSLWGMSAGLTFGLVKRLLSPFLAHVVADPATKSIGSQAFQVQIAPECSGIEGAGLMLIFSVLWLWFFRKESRFPQALLLIPAGVTLMWLLNGLRIATLILIGNAGAPAVALGGFHSQAGWMAFNVVALGFAVGVQRLPWITTRPPGGAALEGAKENPTAAYLVPFLAILAAAMISRAASSGFEWLYPLRLFAVAPCLWFFRAKYKSLDWRVGWVSLLVGLLVFGLWLGLDRLAGAHPASGIATGLALWPGPARVCWLALRTLAAVVTVPVAEELAFRGFLMRRLISRDFEGVPMTTTNWLALLGSSLAFGAMHGERWIAGTAAGLLYAAALLRRGRIGDAAAAHGTTNALLAAWVLLRGEWSLW